jgi:tRNA-uridine 2-sulfurtransferase
MPVRPGPTALLRRAQAMNRPVSRAPGTAQERPGSSYEDGAQLREALQLAAALVVRFGRKIKDGPIEGEVRISMGRETHTLTVLPLADQVFQEWILNDADH